jgi:GT2 family glycosyltransferase
VVISTYSKDRLRYLLDCIASLKKQSLKPDEIILVLDPYPDLVEFYESRLLENVRVVTSQKRGLSNARNAGVRSAKGEILAFIDDDAVADENWLENLVKDYEDTNVVGVGGLIKPLWEDGYPEWFPEELNWIVGCSYKGLPECKASVRNPIGCNMAFRKTVFGKVGYFRSDIGRFGKRLLASEETELSMRILEKISNSKIIYEPSAVVYHRVDKSRVNLKYLWKRSFYEGVSKALIISSKKNPSTALSTEDRYLKYLLRVAIPLRLKRIYKFENLCQLIILLFSLSAVFVGFSVGRFESGARAKIDRVVVL